MRLTRLVYLLIAVLALALPSLAKPELKPIESLKSTYRTDEKYVLTLEYTDPDGYTVKTATFHDGAEGAIAPFPAKSVSGNTEGGLRLNWEMNGFAKEITQRVSSRLKTRKVSRPAIRATRKNIMSLW